MTDQQEAEVKYPYPEKSKLVYDLEYEEHVFRTDMLRDAYIQGRQDERKWIPVTPETLPDDNQKILFLLKQSSEIRYGSFLHTDQWGRKNIFCDGAFHLAENVLSFHIVKSTSH